MNDREELFIAFFWGGGSGRRWVIWVAVMYVHIHTYIWIWLDLHLDACASQKERVRGIITCVQNTSISEVSAQPSGR